MNKLVNLFFGFSIFLIAVPFNYFFENNFNALPIQFLLCIFISRSFFKIKLNNLLFLVFSFLILIIVSAGDIINFTLSAVTASFLVFWLIIFSGNPKFPQTKSNSIVNSSLFFIGVMLVYFTLDFYLNNDIESRSKGFGSGTVFAILGIYGFCIFYQRYISKKIKFTKFIFFCALFGIPILITQSRGALVTIIFVFFAFEFKSLKKINWRRVLLVFVVFGYSISNSPIINRFNTTNYEDLNQLTSGRSLTQFYILESFVNESNLLNILIGNGFNSLKELVYKGYEYPHFDMLFLLYEGGIVLVLLYVLTLFKVHKVFNNKIFFWIYFISSLHTNIIISPGIFFLSKILDNQFNLKKTYNEYNTSISNQSI
jgi:hypothetical protein